jgi:hypothetical protein
MHFGSKDMYFGSETLIIGKRLDLMRLANYGDPLRNPLRAEKLGHGWQIRRPSGRTIIMRLLRFVSFQEKLVGKSGPNILTTILGGVFLTRTS